MRWNISEKARYVPNLMFMINDCLISDIPDRFVRRYEGLTACYLYQFFISLTLFDIGVTAYGVRDLYNKLGEFGH